MEYLPNYIKKDAEKKIKSLKKSENPCVILNETPIPIVHFNSNKPHPTFLFFILIFFKFF